MKSKIQLILFFVILCFGIFLRVILLDKVPASPDWDEVALGYNAYSILTTGRDEYGGFLPVVLRSFDDYKPALYAYLIIPFIKIFDLSVLAVRLPTVIFGTLGLATTFFLVRELFPNGIGLGKFKVSKEYLSLTIMFLLAISPWHIQFSRVAFEANVGLTINLLAILFFLKSLKNKYFLPLSLVLASANLYVYQSEKVYIPLLFLVLLIVFLRELLRIPKSWLAISVLSAIVVSAPMLFYIITNPNALTRAKGVSVFSNTMKLLEDNSRKLERDRVNNDYIGMVLDNRRIEYVRAFATGYLSHFEPNWFFHRGDELRHQPPFMGLLYLFELPLILIGLYVFIFSSIDRRVKYFLVSYILIAPIPASITIDVPHAVRTINFLPSFQILSAIGLLFLLYNIFRLNILLRIPILALVALVIIFNFSYYLNQYFVQMNYYYSKAWQYGWEEAVKYTQGKIDKFDHVVVSNVPPLDQSYMFFLFYTKYDPKKYLSEGGTKGGRFDETHTAFEKFTFRPIDWEKDKLLRNTLFIGRPADLPDNIDRTIYYLNGERAIVFSERYE